MNRAGVFDVVTEYGVRLQDGTVCPATNRAEAWRFAGRVREPLYRQVVRATHGSPTRRNLIQTGPWQRLHEAVGT